jgi:phage-related protein
LTNEAILAKNSLTDEGLWLFLFDLVSPDGLHLRITSNNDDVIWQGNTYVAFPIEMDEYKENAKGELPSLSLRVSNVTRAIQAYVENDPDFGSNWDVTLNVVYLLSLTKSITTDRPSELTLFFISLGVSCDEQWCTFNLGMENPLRNQFPYRKFAPMQCQASFKNPDTGCPYTGADSHCDKTLEACKNKFGSNADIPFVGFPGIPTGQGVYKVDS